MGDWIEIGYVYGNDTHLKDNMHVMSIDLRVYSLNYMSSGWEMSLHFRGSFNPYLLAFMGIYLR